MAQWGKPLLGAPISHNGVTWFEFWQHHCFQSGCLLMHLAGSRLWSKYVCPCHAMRRPSCSSWSSCQHLQGKLAGGRARLPLSLPFKLINQLNFLFKKIIIFNLTYFKYIVVDCPTTSIHNIERSELRIWDIQRKTSKS